MGVFRGACRSLSDAETKEKGVTKRMGEKEFNLFRPSTLGMVGIQIKESNF